MQTPELSRSLTGKLYLRDFLDLLKNGKRFIVDDGFVRCVFYYFSVLINLWHFIIILMTFLLYL